MDVPYRPVQVAAGMPGMTVFVDEHLSRTLLFHKSPVVPVVINFRSTHGFIDAVVTGLIARVPIDVVVAPRHVNVQDSVVQGIVCFQDGRVRSVVGVSFRPKFNGHVAVNQGIGKFQHGIIGSIEFHHTVAAFKIDTACGRTVFRIE